MKQLHEGSTIGVVAGYNSLNVDEGSIEETALEQATAKLLAMGFKHRLGCSVFQYIYLLLLPQHPDSNRRSVG